MPGVTMHENGGSKAGENVWVVTDGELEILPRNQVCRAAGEIYAQWDHLKWNKPSLESLQLPQREGARWQVDLPEKKKGTGEATVESGKTRDQQTFKSCALAGMWTGRWSLQEAILVQSKLIFWPL